MQFLWDPEPKNDQEPNEPIWCLGKEYTSHESGVALKGDPSEQYDDPKAIWLYADPFQESLTPIPIEDRSKPEDVPTQARETDLGWPETFISDFESRIWITYRSNFDPIPKPQNYDGNSTITLGVRLRSQLMDPHGFTSDTGWGCMIRSGQNLLANALSVLFLGRGNNHPPCQAPDQNACLQPYRLAPRA